MANVTSVPDGDQATGSWTTTPLWSDVDDDIDSHDSTVISSPNNPDTASNSIEFTLDDPVPVGTSVDTVELRIRAQKNNNNRTLDLKVILRDASDVEVTSFTATLTTTMANYTGGAIDVANITKADWGNHDLRIEPTTGGGAGQPTTADVEAVNIDLVTTSPIPIFLNSYRHRHQSVV